MTALTGKKIIVGVTGGIAAYKTPCLVRRLIEAGAVVQVVMTESAKAFITPMTLQAVSGRMVRDALFGLEEEHAMSHIALARWADIILIAPATANAVARLAAGSADDLLTTVCLATTAQTFICPAMNQQMWQHALTQKNIDTLRQHHYHMLGPAVGSQACGEVGPGRMLEVDQIVAQLSTYFSGMPLQGHTVVITAGPTQEPIDAVRYISNYSSGKMGYALASSAINMGARVILISGPCALAPPQGVEMVAVVTADQMLAAVSDVIDQMTIFIGCAAVVDYRPSETVAYKIKKSAQHFSVSWQKNPDILAWVAQHAQRPQCVIGFAAESDDLDQNALLKLSSKKLDFIVANAIAPDNGMGSDWNTAVLYHRSGSVQPMGRLLKTDLAEKILLIVSEKIKCC